MSSLKFRTSDIKGLTPGLDVSRLEGQFILSGKNFFFDSKGPKSGFGSTTLNDFPVTEKIQTQSVIARLPQGYRNFFFFPTMVAEWLPKEKKFQPVLTGFNLRSDTYKWTWAFLNDKFFICHKLVGIFYTDAENLFFLSANRNGIGVPENAIEIAQSNGHLGVLTEDLLSWSNPSDGLNFAPQFAGAGFQKVSDRVSGKVISLAAVKSGFVTFTDSGMMRSEFGGPATYRHFNSNSDIRPVSPWAVTSALDDKIVIMDKTGLYVTEGADFQPLTEIFNEWLIGEIKFSSDNLRTNCRLDWDEVRKSLYISISQTVLDVVYEDTFVLYAPLDKLGNLNHKHTGLGQVLVSKDYGTQIEFGFTDVSGIARVFDEASQMRLVVPSKTDDIFSNKIDFPNEEAADYEGIVASSGMKFASRDFANLTSKDGWISCDLDEKIPSSFLGESEIHLGYFRQESPAAAIRMSEANEYSLFFEPNAARDLENLSEQFVFSVCGSFDGKISYEEKIPTLAKNFGHNLQFVQTLPAPWHSIKLKASELNHYFHLTGVEITASDAGDF